MSFSDQKKNNRQKLFREKIADYENLSFFDIIKADIAGYQGFKRAFVSVGFWVVLALRITHLLYKSRLNWISFILQYSITVITFSNISRKAIIGPGLRIYHPTNIFVGPHTRIGKNCAIRPRVFIASKIDAFDKEDYPTIGDNCRIAVGAVILGNIVIGDNVWVGPNAVITKSIPDNHDVVSPAVRAIPRNSWKK